MPMPEEKEDAFGFESLRAHTKDRIRDIKPSAPHGPAADIAKIDALADSVGFVSREAYDPQPGGGRNRRPEPRSAINMRVPVTLSNAFQRFCEENRYSYPEGLEEIMRRAGLPLR